MTGESDFSRGLIVRLLYILYWFYSLKGDL